MRAALISILLILGLGNETGSLFQAQEAFVAGAYTQSARFYRQALREYPTEASSIYYNLAHCMMRLDSVDQATEMYQMAMRPESPGLASKAANNLGILWVEAAEMKQALEAFRQALVFDPENEVARRNFETLKYRLKKNPGEADQEPPSFQNNEPDQSEEPDQNQADPSPPSDLPVGEYRDMIEQLRAKRRNWKGGNDLPSAQSLDTISISVAQDILEEMREKDMQFLQQLRKSPASTSKKNDKPSW